MMRNHFDGTELIHRLMGKFLRFYIIEVRSHTPATVQTYKEAYKSYLRFLKEQDKITAAKLSLEHFSIQHIEAYIAWMKEKGLKPASINLRLSALKTFAAFVIEEEPAATDVMLNILKLKNIRSPSKGTGTAPVKFLSKVQLKMLLAQMDLKDRYGFRDYVLTAFTYLTGARVSEMVSIRLQDLTIEGKSASVRLYGKGRKVRVIPLEDTKFVKQLKIYINRFHSKSSNEDYLFYTNHREGKTQMHRSTVDGLLKQYGKSAAEKLPGFPLPLHCHMLRHSRAMHLHAEGMPITHLRDFLGHASIETTMIYAWTEVTEMRKNLKKVHKLKVQSLNEETSEQENAEALKKMGLI